MANKSNLIGKTVLGYWHIDEFVGSGGYGNVYKAHRMIGNDKTFAAIKHIVIPGADQYKERLFSNRNDRIKTDKYFKKLYDDILNEIRALDKLSGKSINIVAYRNHEVVEHNDPVMYEIFIEMEFLTPFNKYCEETPLSVKDILKIGIDVASGLKVCHSKDIMHRDIKETNIFVDSDGNFKLGDFGLAKILSEGSKAKSDAGTAAYKAPEVALPFSEYKKTVDIYSLGIVLYRMFNYGRIPFLPPYPEDYDYEHENMALARRLRGETPPCPQNAPEHVAEIIMKACAPSPENRFQTVEELKNALMGVMDRLESNQLQKIVWAPADENMEAVSGSSKGWDSFGKPVDEYENYVHQDIFGSYGGHKPKGRSGFEEKDRKLWEAALKVGTVYAFKEYLEYDIHGKQYEQEARKRIRQLELEADREKYEKLDETARYDDRSANTPQPGNAGKPNNAWYRDKRVIAAASAAVVVSTVIAIAMVSGGTKGTALNVPSPQPGIATESGKVTNGQSPQQEQGQSEQQSKSNPQQQAQGEPVQQVKEGSQKQAQWQSVQQTEEVFQKQGQEQQSQQQEQPEKEQQSRQIEEPIKQQQGNTVKPPSPQPPAAQPQENSGQHGSIAKAGDYVQFGSYLGAPVLWKCVRKDGNSVMLVSEYILCFKAYDAAESGTYNKEGGNYTNNVDMQQLGSNAWANSNIREWLNSASQKVSYSTQPPTAAALFKGCNAYEDEPGFLCGFSGAERELIQAVSHGGVTDKVYLLSESELPLLGRYENSRTRSPSSRLRERGSRQDDNLGYWWWVRSQSGAYSCYVKNINQDSVLSSNIACDGNGGVVPAVNLKTDIFKSGSGTKEQPYKL